MKKIMKISLSILVAAFFLVSSSNAQEIVIRARLHHAGPVFVRPVRPTPHHVWVSEEWVPGGRTYVYHEGYWALAPRPGIVWVSGSWRFRHGGYVWIPGHWSR